nr:MAG TPA: hypothetical protein [Caudoviricetes sp.]
MKYAVILFSSLSDPWACFIYSVHSIEQHRTFVYSQISQICTQ